MPVNPETSHVDQIQAAIASNGAAKSALIASWRRSSTLHRLDPTETRSPERVSDSELAKVRQEIEPLIRVAQASLERLPSGAGP